MATHAPCVMNQRSVVIVGDGPAGLSAALLLAKNGFEVDVVGTDETPVHKAHLHNVLGIDEITGPEYVRRARDHVEQYGARLHKGRVTQIEVGETMRVTTDDGTVKGHYLVLANGFRAGPVDELRLDTTDHGVRADKDGRTSLDRVYAGGGLVRGQRSQVATSLGDGAAIAVDILSRVAGKPTHDWDVMKAPRPEQPAE